MPTGNYIGIPVARGKRGRPRNVDNAESQKLTRRRRHAATWEQRRKEYDTIIMKYIWIQGSHSGDYEEYYILGCDAV
jgi:hypothetical protein